MNGEALGEGVVDAVLHKDAVGADAGLAGLPVFRSDAALERHLDIGVGFRIRVLVRGRNRRTVLDRPGSRISVPLLKLFAQTKVRAEFRADRVGRRASHSI
jgi:hypothetical protein